MSVRGVPALLTVAFVAVCASARSARAQSERDEEPSQRVRPTRAPTRDVDRTAWTLRVRARLRGEYDDNVFFLSPRALARLHVVTDPPSRYRGMDSNGSWLAIPRLRGELRGPSPLGGRLSIRLGAAYAIYLQDRAKSYPELVLHVRQDAGRRGHAFLRVEDQIGFYYNNAVVGGQDLNGSGSIESPERHYAPIVYDELVAMGGYACVLHRARGTRSLGVEAALAAGYYRRSFRPPLAARQENAPLGRGRLSLTYRRLVRLDAVYTFMHVFNAPHPEVVLLDETAWGVDVSMPPDGNATDPYALTMPQVDRSYTMNRLGIGLSIRPWRHLVVAADYDLRVKDYTSGEPRDVAHFDRSDTRHVALVTASWRVSSRWRIGIGYRYAFESTHRTPGPLRSLDRTSYEINRTFADVSATW